MDKMDAMLQELVRSNGIEWDPRKKEIHVTLGSSGRHQTIRVRRENDDYFLTSVVLSADIVTRTTRQWNNFARFAWLSNAEHELVAFGFDGYDCLVGQIRHPVKYLDAPELELYIRVLAQECDRMEYLLSGKDEN